MRTTSALSMQTRMWVEWYSFAINYHRLLHGPILSIIIWLAMFLVNKIVLEHFILSDGCWIGLIIVRIMMMRLSVCALVLEINWNNCRSKKDSRNHNLFTFLRTIKLDCVVYVVFSYTMIRVLKSSLIPRTNFCEQNSFYCYRRAETEVCSNGMGLESPLQLDSISIRVL